MHLQGQSAALWASVPLKCSRSQLRTQLHGDPHLPLLAYSKANPKHATASAKPSGCRSEENNEGSLINPVAHIKIYYESHRLTVTLPSSLGCSTFSPLPAISPWLPTAWVLLTVFLDHTLTRWQMFLQESAAGL